MKTSTKNNFIIWGAGKIGRGFIAELLNNDDHKTFFIDQSEELVEELNRRRSYQIINAFDRDTIQKIEINDYVALTTNNSTEIQNIINECDYVFVAVYPKFFESVAKELAKFIVQRKKEIGPKPLDIILCTNLLHAGIEFEKFLYKEINDDCRQYFKERIGIVETLVIRICADPNNEISKEDPLAVLTNGFPQLLVDTNGFRGTIPQWETFMLVKDMQAEEKRKLFTYNMFHAVLAYFGVMKQYKLIPECIVDSDIEKIASGALEESCKALELEFDFSSSEMKTWKENVVRQTNNPIVGDTVFRYAADPIRKLSREDRLIGPALLCIKNGIDPENIILGIAAGFHFLDDNDSQSMLLRNQIDNMGIEKTIREVCGLKDEDNHLFNRILNSYNHLSIIVPFTRGRINVES